MTKTTHSISKESAKELLQGEWEYVSYEEDGVVKKYKSGISILSIAGETWTVKQGLAADWDRAEKSYGGGGVGAVGPPDPKHRVDISGSQLTFHGKTSTGSASGVGGSEPSIAYGIFRVDDNSLVYCLTPFSAEVHVVHLGVPSVPLNLETEGTMNTVHHLRRIQPLNQ